MAILRKGGGSEAPPSDIVRAKHEQRASGVKGAEPPIAGSGATLRGGESRSGAGAGAESWSKPERV